MQKFTRYIIVAIFSLLTHSLIAQQGVYIPHTGKIFFKSDSATIFSSVINQGSIGIGENAFVNFTGEVWENTPASLLTDEYYDSAAVAVKSGWIRFLSSTRRQKIIGGYNAAMKSGPVFSRIQIQNRFGVELNGSNAKISKEITLIEGLVYLRDNILVVGNKDPGIINGYTPSRYFVTGNAPGAGMLLRENISSVSGQVDFPVGSRANAYTPAAVRSNSTDGDDYYVNVFDSVKSNLFSEKNLVAEGVNKTWAIGKSFRPGMDEAEVYLQHLNSDEGSFFTANKKYAYVAMSGSAGWDVGNPQRYPDPGILTSGRNPVDNSGVNSRIFNNEISGPSYFTKLTGSGDSTTKTKLWFNANSIDPLRVYVYWKTNPEYNVQYFAVERRLANENTFTSVDTVSSQALRGGSVTDLNYSITDSNSYSGISFYRLKLLDYNNSFTYSNIVAVDRGSRVSSNLIWPNPAHDRFYVSLSRVTPVRTIIIMDILGHKMKQEKVNGRYLIEMGGLMPGTYFVSLVGMNNNIIETKKLVVIGD